MVKVVSKVRLLKKRDHYRILIIDYVMYRSINSNLLVLLS